MRYVRERKEERRGEEIKGREERIQERVLLPPHPESVKAGWVCSAG